MISRRVIGASLAFCLTFIACSDENGIGPPVEPPPSGHPWPMLLGNPQHTGLSPYVGPQKGEVAWVFEAGNEIVSCPAVGQDGTIYFGSTDKYLYALNPDGTLKWKFLTIGGMSSAPAIGTDGTVYVTTAFFEGWLYAISSDGVLKWSQKLRDTPIGGSSPMLGDGGDIFVTSLDTLWSFRPDGTVSWKVALERECKNGGPAIAADGNLIITTSGSVYSFTKEGLLQWEYSDAELEALGDIYPSVPSVDKEGTIYFNARVTLYALNADGSFKWKVPYGTDAPWGSSPTISNSGRLYTLSGYSGYLNALDRNGNLLWRTKVGRATENSPIIGDDGTVYVGKLGLADSTNFVAVTQTGDIKWAIRLLTPEGRLPDIDSIPAIGKDGTLYVGSDAGGRHLFAIK